MPYLTDQEARDIWLHADTLLTDPEIARLNAWAREIVEDLTGHQFIPETMARTFNGSGRAVQPLDMPIQAVTQIECRERDGSWTIAGFGDVRISKSRQMLGLGNVVSFSQAVAHQIAPVDRLTGLSGLQGPCGIWSPGFQNIRITGDWGRFFDVPRSINAAIGMLIEKGGSCDNPAGYPSEPYTVESVPGGRSYTVRQIEKNVATDRMTGYSEIDAIIARYRGTYLAVTVL